MQSDGVGKFVELRAGERLYAPGEEQLKAALERIRSGSKPAKVPADADVYLGVDVRAMRPGMEVPKLVYLAMQHRVQVATLTFSCKDGGLSGVLKASFADADAATAAVKTLQAAVANLGSNSALPFGKELQTVLADRKIDAVEKELTASFSAAHEQLEAFAKAAPAEKP